MVVLEDVSWKSGIKWGIAVGIGGLIIAVPLVILTMAAKGPTASPEIRVGSRGVEVATPITTRKQIF